MGPRRVTAATLDVLQVLLGGSDEMYGLRIAKAIARPTGSVFPILARLEEYGWVTSVWQSSESSERGARKRFYRLTSDGAAHARALLASRRGQPQLRAPSPTRRLVPRADGAP